MNNEHTEVTPPQSVEEQQAAEAVAEMLKLKDSTAYVVKMMDMLREPKEEMEYLRDVMQ
jgi:hypothetical protein